MATTLTSLLIRSCHVIIAGGVWQHIFWRTCNKHIFWSMILLWGKKLRVWHFWKVQFYLEQGLGLGGLCQFIVDTWLGWLLEKGKPEAAYKRVQIKICFKSLQTCKGQWWLQSKPRDMTNICRGFHTPDKWEYTSLELK